MKHAVSKQRPRHNVILATLSLLYGYCFWLIMGASQSTHRWVEVPICFSAVPEHVHIQAPETATLLLRSQRSLLRSLPATPGYVHFHTDEIQPGTHTYAITPGHALLPNNTNMLDCLPSHITITRKDTLDS